MTDNEKEAMKTALDSANKWFQRAAELEAENKVLREALEHFASAESWFAYKDYWAYSGGWSPPFKIAREALDR